MSEGQGVKRYDVMYNDFIIVGPKADPAHISGDKDVADALRKIAAAKAPFISRGDRSGTNEAELRLWKIAGVDVAAAKGDWYREIGQGMGPALNMASSSNAYLLSDRGTWLSFKNRGDLADPHRRRQAAVQPVWRDAGEPGEASHRENQRRPSFCRLADLVRRDRKRLPATRSAASSYFSPMRPTSRNAAVETTTLSDSRINPSPSASGRSPLLVSSTIAVVMVRV